MELEIMSGVEGGAEKDFPKGRTDYKINDSKNNNYIGDIASIFILWIEQA